MLLRTSLTLGLLGLASHSAPAHTHPHQGILELAGQGPMDAVALGDRKVREMRPCNWARVWLGFVSIHPV